MDIETDRADLEKSNDLSMLTVTKFAARALRKLLPAGADLGRVSLDLTGFDCKEVALLRSRMQALKPSERNYWTGTLYTLMITPEARRAQAAYFTPPYLADAVIDLAIRKGFDLRKDDVLDPAAGGAAFLSLIAERMAKAGCLAEDIAYRLNGIEIDPCLAEISESLIADRLDGFRARKIVRIGDALRTEPVASYGLVIANPPYGRIFPKDLDDESWTKVSHSGHINKYAVFAELCFRVAKPRGIVALVIPSSFRSGPLYDKMRQFISSQGQILALGTVTNRDDVFADVAQDISVLIVKKGPAHKQLRPVEFPEFTATGIARPVVAGALPEDLRSPWPMPSRFEMEKGGATIADYGATAKAGYFVWNREGEKFCEENAPNSYPLVWANNVRAGQPCVPRKRAGLGVDYVRVPEGSTSIVSTPAIVMQRTTNSSQPRRIIAALIDEASGATHGGFVTENHTIVLPGADRKLLELLAILLNTKAVDDRYRSLSGTATVSVKLLRDLDLPTPKAFRAALRKTKDPEKAATAAYWSGIAERTAMVS